MAEKVILAKGQVWLSGNGARQIDDVRASGITDKAPLGTIVISWVEHSSKYGICTERSFRRWMAHGNATLVNSQR